MTGGRRTLWLQPRVLLVGVCLENKKLVLRRGTGVIGTRLALERLQVDDDTTQIEFWLRGTPTTSGRPFEVRLWALFSFDADDLMTNERVYVQQPTPDQIAGASTG